jgi:hypothetical protein
MGEIKFKIEFVCEGFENLSKMKSMGSKHNQKIKAKV